MLRIVAHGLMALALALPAGAATLFTEDFESGLDRWEIPYPRLVRVVDSGDPEHGRVLELRADGPGVYALVRGSEGWEGFQVDGQVLFPTDEHNYLGFIYGYREGDGRVDFGSVYIKGNGSYIRVNPRWDRNPARRFYEELKVPLRGEAAIRIGAWQRFRLQVLGEDCHLYVGDLDRPQITFRIAGLSGGPLGFKPRVVGGPVRIDDLTVTGIERLSYAGPAVPHVDYDRDAMITGWKVLGRLRRTLPVLERRTSIDGRPLKVDGGRVFWQELSADARGAVGIGPFVDFWGDRTVAYFLAEFELQEAGPVTLRFSTTDQLAIWLNGRFQGYESGSYFSWHDFHRNPEHEGASFETPDGRAGRNTLLVRVRGGQYAMGGFYFLKPAP